MHDGVHEPGYHSGRATPDGVIVAAAFAMNVASVGVAVYWKFLVLCACLTCLMCSAICVALSSSVGYNVDNGGLESG